MILETERLFLREMTADDQAALSAVLADRENMRYYPCAFDEARVKNWIVRNRERYLRDGFGLWAVCLKETGELIGDCGLTMQRINGTIRPEIGYHIRRDCQRKGYAKEAASAVRDWAFSHTSFRFLYSYMKKSNTPSSATARSLGMRLVEEYRDEEGEQTVVYATAAHEKGKEHDAQAD